MSFPSYFHQINTFSEQKWCFWLFIYYTLIKSLVILCIHNLLKNIFDSSPTPWFWPNMLRNFIKISVTTPKPPNKKMHASPTFKFLSMLQYSYSFKFVLTYFVSYKIGLKVLSGTFFRIGLSFLEAEIWRFLWWRFVGYSLYSTLGAMRLSDRGTFLVSSF